VEVAVKGSAGGLARDAEDGAGVERGTSHQGAAGVDGRRRRRRTGEAFGDGEERRRCEGLKRRDKGTSSDAAESSESRMTNVDFLG
jgi:hypothetical protein